MKTVDKIRILLIDDEPGGLLRRIRHEERDYWLPEPGPKAGEPVQVAPLRELFEVRWLASAEEVREFRDLSKVLSLRDPAVLGRQGWVPEVLCFDYALTGDLRSVEERLPPALAERVSPIEPLRRCAAERGIGVPPSSPPPQTGLPPGWDNEGCYCGGLVLTLFWAHPCSPVALTRKGNDKTADSEAGFFEWMLELDGAGTFKAKGRPSLDWTELLLYGIPELRRRIEQLLEGRMIEIGLDDVFALAETGAHDGVEIRSRYAVRRLPVAGLFLDVAEPERADAAKRWARRCLDILFGDLLGNLGNGERPGAMEGGAEPLRNPALADFRSGMDLAQRLWDAYNSELLPKRYRLSELAVEAAARTLGAEERAELEQLCGVFGADPSELDARGVACRKNCHDLRCGEASDGARRWAALMVMVRLEMQAAAARRTWQEFCRRRGYHEHFDPLIQRVNQDDVYLALFPVPTTPLKTPFELGKDPRTSWGFVLRDLSSGREKKDLGLDVKEVLASDPWCWDAAKGQCDPCGLRRGERYLLRLYAPMLEPFAEEWLAAVPWLQEPLAAEDAAQEAQDDH